MSRHRDCGSLTGWGSAEVFASLFGGEYPLDLGALCVLHRRTLRSACLKRSLAFYDVASDAWDSEASTFTLLVCRLHSATGIP
jgi:hypothetical protein